MTTKLRKVLDTTCAQDDAHEMICDDQVAESFGIQIRDDAHQMICDDQVAESFGHNLRAR